MQAREVVNHQAEVRVGRIAWPRRRRMPNDPLVLEQLHLRIGPGHLKEDDVHGGGIDSGAVEHVALGDTPPSRHPQSE